ncbi:MAG: DUF1616 domain-containing protein [Candidatus Bathyarchaeales archaeon]
MQKLKGKYWFLTIIVFTLVTLLTAYTIPNEYHFAFVRYIFGFIFVSFIPGYCLLRLLFSKDKKIEMIEGMVLSIALSFSIVGLIGLFLGLTSIGLNFTSVTVSLAIVVLALALLAFKRS